MVRASKSPRSESASRTVLDVRREKPARRIKSRENQGSAIQHAKELERATDDLYDPTGMLPKNEAILPGLIRNTKRLTRLAENHFRGLKNNRILRVKSLESSTDDPSKAFILPKTTLRQPLRNNKSADSPLKTNIKAIKNAELYWLEQRQKMACTIIAAGNSNRNNKKIKHAFGLLGQSLKRYQELGGDKTSYVHPILIQALSLRGTKALDHEVHSQAVKELGDKELSCRNDHYEGIEIRFPQDREQADRYERRMLADHDFLTKAVQLVPKMKAKRAVKNFVMASQLHRKAELEHALEHLDPTSPGNGPHIQNARHIVDLGTDYLSRVPESLRSVQHSRLAYNFKAQAKHFCQHEPHSIAHTEANRNVCKTLSQEATPMQDLIIKSFPHVNRPL